MNKNEKDIIDLLSSYLNSSTPEPRDYNWKEIFNYAFINHIVGIISSQMISLPNDYVDKKAKTHYKKYLAKSVVDFEERLQVKDNVVSFLNENSFDFMFVKGVAISQYYPIPELRTSGDIDVVVRPEQFDDIVLAYQNSGVEIDTLNPVTLVLIINGITVEIHKGADVFGNYFNNIFDVAQNDGNYYTLDLYYQLMYVILHLVKHLRGTGAGIRMLMDIDVCIRAIENFDQKKLMNMCKDSGIESCAEVILSLCNYWFNTPVVPAINLENDQELVDLFATGFLNGGTFGFENNDYSALYLTRSSKTGEFGLKEKIKAFFGWVFPPVRIIKRIFFYANKYPFLIPFAYFHRLFRSAFRHKEYNFTTFKGIINPNSASSSISKILAELKIND